MRTAPEIITEKLLEIEKNKSLNHSKTTKKKLKKKNQANGEATTKNPIQTKPLTKTNVPNETFRAGRTNSVNSSPENLESIGDWKPPPGITLTRLKQNDKKETNL